MDYRDNPRNIMCHHSKWSSFTPPWWSGFTLPLTVYILPPSIPKKIEGYRWQSFNPPAAGKSPASVV